MTLGGFDSNRFIPHNISFELNPSQLPQAYINSVFLSSAATANNWTDPVQLLSLADRVLLIDSSTPYLWFPYTVCERFAESLGLVYDASLNLYTFDNNTSQHTVLENSQLTFTFSLSNLGSSGDAVNIRLPYAAFDLQLTYPAVPGSSYNSANSTMYYFPLRQATNEAQYTIGQAFFFQEAYIITDYEENVFSVHQAVHIANPIGNTSIFSITHSPKSSFRGPPMRPSVLSTGAIAGIAAGVAAVVAVLCFALSTIFPRRQHLTKHTTKSYVLLNLEHY